MNEEVFGAAASSIEFYLNPEVSGNEALLRELAHLTSGDLVVIRDGFQAAFAERVFACLDSHSDWKLYEGYEEHFHYRHHNIYDEQLYPEALVRCRDIFDSEATKGFVAGLTQRDCSGRATLAASWYQPGDHSLPHNDFMTYKEEQRRVAFIWNLTKEWQADWGGEFFWCRTGKSVMPAFNSLLLFNVARESMHFVTMVAPHAKGKRLAVSGWWTGKAGKDQNAASAVSHAERQELVEFI